VSQQGNRVQISSADHLSTNSLNQSPSWEANCHWSSQGTVLLSWNPKVNCRVHNSPSIVPSLSLMNPTQYRVDTLKFSRWLSGRSVTLHGPPQHRVHIYKELRLSTGTSSTIHQYISRSTTVAFDRTSLILSNSERIVSRGQNIISVTTPRCFDVAAASVVLVFPLPSASRPALGPPSLLYNGYRG
jgi:hypothetical protein